MPCSVPYGIGLGGMQSCWHRNPLFRLWMTFSKCQSTVPMRSFVRWSWCPSFETGSFLWQFISWSFLIMFGVQLRQLCFESLIIYLVGPTVLTTQEKLLGRVHGLCPCQRYRGTRGSSCFQIGESGWCRTSHGFTLVLFPNCPKYFPMSLWGS